MKTMWRRAGLAGALWAVVCAGPALASDGDGAGTGAGAGQAVATVAEAAAALAPNRFVWAEPADEAAFAAVPVRVVVSIPEQRAYVYRGTTLIAASTVSTGKDGKETPPGVYPILQKAQKHASNLYDAAPMPYMQRLTWDGIAIHAGKNPGFPASHGCIRVPLAFAKKLFEVTQLGSVVVVDDGSYGETALTVPPPPAATAEETAAANRLALGQVASAD
jgi:hypothetical protein